MAKPIVDGIERDLGSRGRVVRLNVLSGIGSEVAARYGVRGVPTLIVFDGQGQVAYQQAGMPERARIVAEAQRSH